MDRFHFLNHDLTYKEAQEKTEMQKGHTIYKQLLTLLVYGVSLFPSADTKAAKAPLSPEELEQEADLIVTGDVVSITSNGEPSKHETAGPWMLVILIAGIACAVHQQRRHICRQGREQIPEKTFLVGIAIMSTIICAGGLVTGRLGLHRDRVYTISLRITVIAKGTVWQKGEEIVVEAWRPTLRIPPLLGLQGHSPLPGQRNTVKMYLVKNKTTKRYQPLLPNGMEIQ